MADDALPTSPAAERNKGPILEQLMRLLPVPAAVLEIASGTGQHAAWFAAAQPQWLWQPSEPDPGALPAIAARCAGLANIRAPLRLDVLEGGWPAQRHDAVYCANMLHIAPWEACAGLMRGAASVLGAGGQLLLYGPYLVDGVETAPSNLAFDADLRARDARWGLRRLAEVSAEAQRAGLRLQQQIGMPANNLLLAYRKG